MTRRKDIQTIHEPFGDAFYYGPERMGTRFEGDEWEEAREKSGFANSTFATILERIERESSEVCLLLFLRSHFLILLRILHPNHYCSTDSDYCWLVVILCTIVRLLWSCSTRRHDWPISYSNTASLVRLIALFLPTTSDLPEDASSSSRLTERTGQACLHQRHHSLPTPSQLPASPPRSFS